jgi:hypothetical protein
MNGGIKMQVYGNGHCVNVSVRYDMPYIKIWESENEKAAYRIKAPYKQGFKIIKLVGDVIEKHGKDNNFWNILGDVLNSQFEIIEFEFLKEKSVNKKNKHKEHIPKINMIATYAKILYKDDTVNVIFSNDQETNTITFKRRKSWSHKKYVDKALSESGITPSWNFRYGWEISA